MLIARAELTTHCGTQRQRESETGHCCLVESVYNCLRDMCANCQNWIEKTFFNIYERRPYEMNEEKRRKKRDCCFCFCCCFGSFVVLLWLTVCTRCQALGKFSRSRASVCARALVHTHDRVWVYLFVIQSIVVTRSQSWRSVQQHSFSLAHPYTGIPQSKLKRRQSTHLFDIIIRVQCSSSLSLVLHTVRLIYCFIARCLQLIGDDLTFRCFAAEWHKQFTAQVTHCARNSKKMFNNLCATVGQTVLLWFKHLMDNSHQGKTKTNTKSPLARALFCVLNYSVNVVHIPPDRGPCENQ